MDTNGIDVPGLITSARWLAHLGEAVSESDTLAVSPEQWTTTIRAGTASDFGLSVDPDDKWTDLPAFDWLNDELDRTEQALKAAANAEGLAAASKAARLEAARLASTSLSRAPDAPLLTVGPTKLHEAVKQAAVLACRVAATEASLGRPGIGCRLLRLYHAGHWPFARTDDGRLLVL